MKIYKEFFRCVIPSMLAFALSGVYAIADGFFVGNSLGDNALAAINIAYPLTAFLQAVGTGIGMGGAVRYAISEGTGNRRGSRQYFGMALVLLIACSAVFTALFLAGAPAALRLFGAFGEIEQLAGTYIRYIAYGAVFQILGTGLVPFIRNMGGAFAAMAAMIAGFAANILLDYLFVWRLPYGMAGAAVATVIGQAVTFGVCAAFLLVRRKAPLFRFDGSGRALLQGILKVGMSPFGLTFSPNITLILVNKSAVLFGGALAVTCYAPISYLSAVILLLLQGVSDGAQPLLSLYYGRGETKLVSRFRNLAYCFAGLTSLACMAVLLLTRRQAAALFGASAQVTGSVAEILPIFVSGYLFVAASRVTTAYLYATEKNLWAYVVIYGEVFFLLVLLLFLPELAGITGTWLAVPISQLLAAAMSAAVVGRESGRPQTGEGHR